MNNYLVAVIKMLCDDLTDLELATLNTVLQLEENPHDRVFDYEKVASIFTENDGLKAHDETKRIVGHITLDRLGNKE